MTGLRLQYSKVVLSPDLLDLRQDVSDGEQQAAPVSQERIDLPQDLPTL